MLTTQEYCQNKTQWSQRNNNIKTTENKHQINKF